MTPRLDTLWRAAALAGWIALAPVAAGGEPQGTGDAFERIDAVVTVANGPVVTLNRGATSGIAKGDTVLVRRVGRADAIGRVVRVTANTCVVELEDLEASVALGVGGEVLVPKSRAVPDGATAKGGVPEHPPWQEPVGEWAPGTPLLAPVSSPTAEERDPDLRGRVYTRARYTDDGDSDRTYARWWTGADVEWSNPFGAGGEFRFQGDASYRDYLTGTRSEDELITRVQRLSYTLGGRDGDDYRVEVGRFLHGVFPEFGIVDGVQYAQRFDGGSQLGGSVGFLPDWNDDLAPTDDLSTAIYYRWVNDPDERVVLAAGYQKTWHGGAADRDLIAGSFAWSPDDVTTVQARALVDYYDGTAVLESSGFEPTELHASVTRRFGVGSGATLYASYFDWPELLKDEFPVPPPETIQDQKVTRGGANGWVRVADGVTVYGRVDLWKDDVNSGDFEDLRVDLRDVLYDGSLFSTGLYRTSGSFVDGLGGRARLTHWIGAGSVQVGYDVTRYTQDAAVAGDDTTLQHVVGVAYDTRITDDLDLTADVEQRFGDDLDALSVGVRATWRF